MELILKRCTSVPEKRKFYLQADSLIAQLYKQTYIFK